jgi:methylthioribose-1-phosphate isomerase
LRTVEWHEGAVRMIDQTLLPHQTVILEYCDYRDVARAIKEMRVRGAPAIGATAAFGMALAARQSQAKDRAALLADLEEAGKILSATRPTAVNLFWAVRRMLQKAHELASTDLDALKSGLLAEAQRIADQDVAINRRMGQHGAAVIRDGDTILTHCNAGALATVDYGTTLGVIRAAHEAGKRIHVFVDETRPFLQGARLTAWELQQEGIPLTLITDNMAGWFMSQGKVNLVLVGADRVAANGDVANKVGTYSLAVLAQENGVPFYPVVPTSTIDLNIATGRDIPIEERDPREVTHLQGKLIAPEGVKAANPAFDVTPRRYLTGIITEEGIIYPPFDLGLRRAKEKGEQNAR